MLRVVAGLFLMFVLSVAGAVGSDGWVESALQLQREIDVDAPLNEATFIGTHNSYNSKAYQIFLFRYIDPNQMLSIKEQLEAGVRSIELDLHWMYTHNLAREILLCHALPSHIGCSPFDRPFTSGLAELRDWLKEHPKELVLLYLERHVDGHEPRMAAQLEEYVGEFIYKTTNIVKHAVDECVALPASLTKAEVLKTGKQLIVVTKQCHDGFRYAEREIYKTPWTDVVFTGIGEIKNKPFNFIDALIADYRGYPECTITQPYKDDDKHTSLWRVYENRTFHGNLKKALRKILLGDMNEFDRCGINWTALDMLEKNDKRLAGAIWSWAQDYPKKDYGHCAAYVLNRGIINVSCYQQLTSFVCRDESSRALKVISYFGIWQDGERACQRVAGKQWHFSLPLNGMQLNAIKAKMPADSTAVWLNYAMNAEGHWQPNLIRG